MAQKTFLTCTGCGSPVADDAARCAHCGVTVDHRMLGAGGGVEASADAVRVHGSGVLRVGADRGEVRVCSHCGASVSLDAGQRCPHCKTKIVIEALAMPSLTVERGGRVVISAGASTVVGRGATRPAPTRGAQLSLGRLASLDEKLVVALERGKLPHAEKRIHQGHALAGVDGEGRTVLGLALGWKRPELVPWLLARGADVEEPDAKGDTALLSAVRRGDEASVALLLERGARWDAVGKDGRSALEVAERGKSAKIVDLLREARRGARAR